MFGRFGQRITRGYVVLACALLLLVVAATSTLAFWLYAGSLNDALVSTAQRASDRVTEAATAHKTLKQAAPQIVKDLGRGRLRVTIDDDHHNTLAGGTAPATTGDRAVQTLISLLGIHRQRVNVPGGTVTILPDLGGFGTLLLVYWSFVIPIGLIAVVLAWLIGRSITRRAVAPLEDVTHALARIAGGDFQPELLSSGTGDLTPLTNAYNDVAYRLNAATAERTENESRMRQFVADAGHELRTPLTVIMGYLDALQRGVVSDPSGVANVHTTMLEESRRMRALIEKLIFLARLDRQPPPSIEAIDVAEVARRAATTLAPLGGERIDVRAPEPAIGCAERGELDEAIRNVLENALKYAPGSRVDLGVRTDDGSVEIRIADRGPGIAAADLPHVFDRFYRGDARYDADGSGLGLSIAKRAVERCGGSVAIESAPGTGTTVTLRVPAAPPDPASATPAPR
jgi:signal transduction histidine kinase